jgi:hypothetical protein
MTNKQANQHAWQDTNRLVELIFSEHLVLAPEQAEQAYDDADPVLISEERIQQIVDYATRQQ